MYRPQLRRTVPRSAVEREGESAKHARIRHTPSVTPLVSGTLFSSEQRIARPSPALSSGPRAHQPADPVNAVPLHADIRKSVRILA